MKGIFGDDSLSPNLTMSGSWNLDTTGAVASDPEVRLETTNLRLPPSGLFAHVVRGTRDLTYFEDRERMMVRGVAKWRIIIEYDLFLSEIGRLCFDSPEELDGSIRAALGTKSPNTVVARANAMLAMMRWQCNARSFENFLPLSESMVWKYVSWLRENQCPPTKPSSLLQAIRFSHYVFGIDGSGSVMKSRRVAGSCDLALADKPTTKQARALTVAEVRKVHKFASDPLNNVVDRTVASHMLLMLYGRCRHSDTLAVQSIEHDHTNDRGYILLNTRYHKGNKSTAKKSLVLPILIPTCGVGTELWAEQWWESRTEIGLVTQGEVNGPLMPAPSDADGKTWAKRPLSSDELGHMLRSILGCLDDLEVTSHSLKVTTLTWCSKGEVPREHRRLLGRHSSSVKDADSLYARELAFPPVRSLEHVISDICMGRFVPDGPRSLFRPDAEPLARTPPNAVTPRSVLPQTPLPGLGISGSPDGSADAGLVVKDEGSNNNGSGFELIEVPSSSFSDSGDEDTSGDSSPTDDEAPVVNAVKRVRVASVTEYPEPGHRWVKHQKTKIVHRCFDTADAITFCGRSITKMFSEINAVTDWTCKCRVCFRGSREPKV